MVVSGLSIPKSIHDGVPPTPSPRGTIPVSEALEILLICSRSANLALSNDVNDESVSDKAGKSFADGDVYKQFAIKIIIFGLLTNGCLSV